MWTAYNIIIFKKCSNDKGNGASTEGRQTFNYRDLYLCFHIFVFNLVSAAHGVTAKNGQYCFVICLHLRSLASNHEVYLSFVAIVFI